MWFSTSEGVLYQDGDGFSRFTPADGLPYPSVKAVLQDREHQYWFATWGGGGLYDAHSISIFDLGSHLSQRSKNMSEISQLVQDRRGDIWVGYAAPFLNRLEKSIFHFDGEHFDLVNSEDDFDINNCFTIYEDHEGYLWFGGVKGLFRYNGQKLKKIHTPASLGESSISTITQNSQGEFLFGYWENKKEKTKRSFCQSIEDHLSAGRAVPGHFCSK